MYTTTYHEVFSRNPFLRLAIRVGRIAGYLHESAWLQAKRAEARVPDSSHTTAVAAPETSLWGTASMPFADVQEWSFDFERDYLLVIIHVGSNTETTRDRAACHKT